MGRRIKSKYSHEDRKNIVRSIENLKNSEDYNEIFEILTNDGTNSYTCNHNGVFLNLALTNDDALDKVNKYIDKVNRKQTNQIEMDVDLFPQSMRNKSERTHKLSNYEKNILKQCSLKNQEEVEYEELHFTSSRKPVKATKSTSRKPKATVPKKKTRSQALEC